MSDTFQRVPGTDYPIRQPVQDAFQACQDSGALSPDAVITRYISQGTTREAWEVQDGPDTYCLKVLAYTHRHYGSQFDLEREVHDVLRDRAPHLFKHLPEIYATDWETYALQELCEPHHTGSDHPADLEREASQFFEHRPAGRLCDWWAANVGRSLKDPTLTKILDYGV